jgi:hypothetical protein
MQQLKNGGDFRLQAGTWQHPPKLQKDFGRLDATDTLSAITCDFPDGSIDDRPTVS